MSLFKKLGGFSNKQFILSRSLMVIIASFIASIFSYLFQITLGGNYLSKQDYGTLGALFALSGIIPLVAQFFLSGLPKLVAEIKDTDYPNRITHLFYSILKINAIITFIILTLLLVFKSNIVTFLNISDTRVIEPFIFAVSAGILTSFMIPYVQGLMRFKAYSFLVLLTAIAKYAVAIIVVKLGFGLVEVFWGLTFATIVMGLISFSVLLKNLNTNWQIIDKKDLSLLIKYSLGSAVALIGLNAVNQMDLLLVKHYFDPELAGIYNSISIIGRIIFYGVSPVAIVMLPICAEKFKKKENFTAPFLAAISVSAVLCLCGIFVYYQFPNLIIKYLFPQYSSSIPYLGLFAIFMFIYTLVFLFVTFYIATSQFKLSSIVFVSAILQIAGIIKFHSNLTQAIYASIFSVMVVLIIYLVIFIGNMNKKKYETNIEEIISAEPVLTPSP